jgi:hypothetical protein
VYLPAIAALLGLGLGHSVQAADSVLPLPAEDAAEITRVLGANVVGQALPSLPITDVSGYFPLEERAAVFHVTSGSNAGKQQTLRTTKGKRPGGNDAWRFELSPALAAFVNQAGGDLVMPAVSDTDEGVIVVSTPANPFILNGMKPGETREFSQEVSVNYLDDPTAIILLYLPLAMIGSRTYNAPAAVSRDRSRWARPDRGSNGPAPLSDPVSVGSRQAFC